MGARWLWYARCPNGHVYWNFSGGADDCYECEQAGKSVSPLYIIDCPHWAGVDENCTCKEDIMKDRAIRYSFGVPVYKENDVEYIRIGDIPSLAAIRAFKEWLYGQTCPIIKKESTFMCAFPWDWERFVEHKPIVD